MKNLSLVSDFVSWDQALFSKMFYTEYKPEREKSNYFEYILKSKHIFSKYCSHLITFLLKMFAKRCFLKKYFNGFFLSPTR